MEHKTDLESSSETTSCEVMDENLKDKNGTAE